MPNAFRELLAAHALFFERPERTPNLAATGRRLLLAFGAVGLVVHPALVALFRVAGLGTQPWTRPVIVVALLLLTLFLVLGVLRLDAAAVGLHGWQAWTRRERLYAWTVLPLAAGLFGVMFRDHFTHLAELHGWWRAIVLSLPTGLLWGAVQELIYRGLLQTALTQRLGGVAGVLLANLVFTFGPLHANYYRVGADAGPSWGMFAAIFAIGLFFGILYHRSGNLWLPAVMHGLWPLNMT